MGNSCSRVPVRKASARGDDVEKAKRMIKLRNNVLSPSLSLVQLCLVTLASRPDLTEGDISAISHDLAQELLDVMVRTKTLNQTNFEFFRSQRPWKLCLASYSGVRNDWVSSLVGADLLSLDLSSCEVDDAAMRIIGGCRHLKSLDMSKTVVTAAGFAHLGELGSLRRLRFSDCDGLDGRSASSLAALTALELLDLSLCKRVSLGDLLPSIEGCTRLRHLDVSWCRSYEPRAAGGLGSLQRLTALTSLNLSKARFDSATLPALKCLSNLASLNLGDHAFDQHALRRTNVRDGHHRVHDSEFAVIGALAKLTNLELRWCQMPNHHCWSLLTGLSALERLDVSFVRTFCSSSIAQLVALTALTYLNLDSTAITNPALNVCSALTRLNYLNLSDTRVEDVALTHLYRLSQLQGLDLSYSFITDLGVDLLRELTKLTYLSIDSRLITDLGLKCLSPLTNIISLDIYGCKMTYLGAQCIAKLPNVSWLAASGGTLCDKGVQVLSAMTRLTYLSISQNESVTDEAIPALARLTNLRSLNLSGTKVTASRLPLLSSLTALESLALYKTCVKPCVLKKMAAAWPDVLITGVPDIKAPATKAARA